MNGGVSVDKEYRMTIVDLNNIGYRNDPFVLAADVNQVFYVKHDEKKTNEPKHHIVLTGKRNIMGIEDKLDVSEDY
jgi:hypothetical protein